MIPVAPATVAAADTALVKDSFAGKDAGFYGHAGDGCLQVRPMLALKREADADQMERMMHAISA